MQTIYQRIEWLIESRGMTKKAFCEQLGISTGNFGDWKRGKTTPSTNKLIEISEFFSVSLDWLIVGRGSSAEAVMERQETYLIRQDMPEMALLEKEELEFIREYIRFSVYRKDKSKNNG